MVAVVVGIGVDVGNTLRSLLSAFMLLLSGLLVVAAVVIGSDEKVKWKLGALSNVSPSNFSPPSIIPSKLSRLLCGDEAEVVVVIVVIEVC